MANSDSVPVHGMSARRLRDQELNRAAYLRLISAHVPGPLRNIVDIRYGSGRLALEVSALFSDPDVLGVEADAETHRRALRPDRGYVLQRRYEARGDLPPEWYAAGCDLLLGDFSDVTKRNRGDAEVAARDLAPGWFAFTDVAAGKLHLHRRTYGLSAGGGLEEYWQSWGLPGYGLVGWERAHYRVSIGLFRRDADEKAPG